MGWLTNRKSKQPFKEQQRKGSSSKDIDAKGSIVKQDELEFSKSQKKAFDKINKSVKHEPTPKHFWKEEAWFTNPEEDIKTKRAAKRWNSLTVEQRTGIVEEALSKEFAKMGGGSNKEFDELKKQAMELAKHLWNHPSFKLQGLEVLFAQYLLRDADQVEKHEEMEQLIDWNKLPAFRKNMILDETIGDSVSRKDYYKAIDSNWNGLKDEYKLEINKNINGKLGSIWQELDQPQRGIVLQKMQGSKVNWEYINQPYSTLPNAFIKQLAGYYYFRL